jgi:1,2-diacylglycerol 3-alpha-glucosyltransferase
VIRVALVIAGPYPHSRGSQMLLRQLEVGLRGRGHEVTVFAHAPGASAAPVFGIRRVGRDLQLGGRLFAALRRGAIDVIHAHNYEAALVAIPLGRGLGVPVVFHAHASYRDELPHYAGRRWRGVARWVGAQLDRYVPRAAAAVVAVTPMLAGVLAAHGAPDGRVTHIPPSLPSDEPAAPVTLPEDPNLVVYVGNLDGYQNLPMLWAAFAQVRQWRPAARLLVATDVALSATPGWPAMAGLDVNWGVGVDAARRAIARAAVVVLPRTDGTGFPMKLLNYLAAGKAIVACAGSAHGLQPGSEALIVPDGAIDAFANAIEQALSDEPLRRRLGAAARRRFDANAPAAALERIESIYRRVLAQMPPRLLPVTQPE